MMMHNIIMTTQLAFVSQVDAKDCMHSLAENFAGHKHEPMIKLIDALLKRALTTPPLHYSYLDATTFGKSAQYLFSSHTSLRSLPSIFQQGPIFGGSTSPRAEHPIVWA